MKIYQAIRRFYFQYLIEGQMTKRVDRYTLSEIIGKGNFAVVQKATHQTKSGQFAVKVISNATILQNPKLEQCLINQVEALSKVENCEYIIKYYEMIRTKNNFYFVYEYCDGGNLLEYLKKTGPLPEKEALAIFKQLIQAFKVLNRLNVMHRDLKPENIFLHKGKAKLGDFGFCKSLKLEDMTKTMLGSPLYMAPEVLKGQLYTVKADVWSLGVILYEMVYGFCPFQSGSIAMLVSKIATTEIDFQSKGNEVSQNTKNLMRKMLNKDYITRSSWSDLFNEKIDLEGNYVQYKQQYLREFNHSRRRVEQPTKYPSTCKRNSLVDREHSNKQNKAKSFYSQRYMDLLSISQNANDRLKTPLTRTNQRKQSIAKYFEQKQSGSAQSNELIEQLRRQTLKKYNKCSEVTNLMREQLEKQNKQTVGYSYSVLCKVYQTLKSICGSLSQHPNHFIEYINSLKFQMIHINQQVYVAKEQLKKLNIAIPLSDHPCDVLDQRILNFLKGQSGQSK